MDKIDIVSDIEFSNNKALTSAMLVKSYVSCNKNVVRSKIFGLLPYMKADDTAVKVMKMINEYCIKRNINLHDQARFMISMHVSTILQVALNLTNESYFEPNEYATNILFKEKFPGLKPLPNLLRRLWEDTDFQIIVGRLEEIAQEQLNCKNKAIYFTANEMSSFLGTCSQHITVYLLPSYTSSGGVLRYNINGRIQMYFDIAPVTYKYLSNVLPIHETIHCFMRELLDNLDEETMKAIYNNLLTDSIVKKNWEGLKETYIDEILTRVFTAHCLNMFHNNTYGDKCIHWDERQNGYIGLTKLWERFNTIKSKYYRSLKENRENFLAELIKQ